MFDDLATVNFSIYNITAMWHMSNNLRREKDHD